MNQVKVGSAFGTKKTLNLADHNSAVHYVEQTPPESLDIGCLWKQHLFEHWKIFERLNYI